LSTASPAAALDGTTIPARAATKAGRIERRCSTRPRFLESWRKIIPPDCDWDINGPSVGERLRVSVWVARTQSLVQAQSSFKILTDDDWSALAQLRAHGSRDCALAAKIMLRLGLSQTVGRQIAPREWKFERTSLGKPQVTGSPLDINFSVSHTDAVTVVAVASKLNLGIDVESTDQDLTAHVVAGFCHANEQAPLMGLPQYQRAREFIRLWTQKEAYTKLLGCGHSIEFSTIECTSDGIPTGGNADLSSSIHFENFFVPVDHCLYHASLAIEKPTVRSVDVHLINVVGPTEKNGVSPVTVVN
jgi:phosphopantetheinyl transferase